MYELLITKVNGVDSKIPSSTEFINKSLYEFAKTTDYNVETTEIENEIPNNAGSVKKT